MAKTLKDFLEGYLKVKSADEQKFVDKHVIAKNPDRNGNGDDVFKGSTKAIERRKERKGYDPGDDEKVYEETDLTESTYEFDISGEHGKAGVDKLVKHAQSKGIKARVHTYDGPGGGNPVIHLSHKDPKALHSYVNTHMYPVRDISRHKINEELKGKQHKIDANKNGKLDAHDFKLLRAKKKVAEAIEELDELSKGTVQKYKKAAVKDFYDADDVDDGRRVGQRYKGIKMANRKLAKEEAEQIDELSQDKLMQYRSAAKKQGTGIQDKMKIGGGDWSKDGKDTNTLKKRMAGYKMAGRKVNPGLSASVGKAPRVAATEEVQIDELSKKTLAKYIPAAAKDAERAGAHQEYFATAQDFRSGRNRQKGIERAVKKLAKEEAEQIDETAKIVAHLQKRYGDNIRKSHVISAANDFGVDASKLAKAVRTKLGKNMLGEKLNMDKASMGDVITDFKDSNAPQFKGKSPAKRRAMAIAAKLTAERGGKPLNKEERLQNRLNDISESHQRVMLEVFDKLNEDNKSKFLEACSTPDGVDQMLDFAIRYRGE